MKRGSATVWFTSTTAPLPDHAVVGRVRAGTRELNCEGTHASVGPFDLFALVTGQRTRP
jgi:hypothetical protein